MDTNNPPNPFASRKTKAKRNQSIAFWIFRLLTYVIIACATYIFLDIGIKGGRVVLDRGSEFLTSSPQTLYIFDLFFVENEDGTVDELPSAEFNNLLREKGVRISGVKIQKSGEIEYLYRFRKQPLASVEEFKEVISNLDPSIRLVDAREYTINSNRYISIQQAASIAESVGGSFSFFGQDEMPVFNGVFVEIRSAIGFHEVLAAQQFNARLSEGLPQLQGIGADGNLKVLAGEADETLSIAELNGRLLDEGVGFSVVDVRELEGTASEFVDFNYTLSFANARGRQTRFASEGLEVEAGYSQVTFEIQNQIQTVDASVLGDVLSRRLRTGDVRFGLEGSTILVRADQVYGPFDLDGFNRWIADRGAQMTVSNAETYWFDEDAFLRQEKAFVWADAVGATIKYGNSGDARIWLEETSVKVPSLSPEELRKVQNQGLSVIASSLELKSKTKVFTPEKFLRDFVEKRQLKAASFDLPQLSPIVGPTGSLVAGLSFNPGAEGLSYTGGGIFPNIVGTILLVIGAIVISLVLGVLAAIYLSEYSKPGTMLDMIRLSIMNLAGVPSIVFGIFGFGLFVFTAPVFTDIPSARAAFVIPLGFTNLSFQGWDTALLGGCFTLAFMVLPVIISSSEEALKSIPKGFREGSLALGATKWTSIRTNVLPYALPGILTSSILGITRVAGETAPIMFTAAFALADRLPWSNGFVDMLFQGVMALPYHIYVVSAKIPQNEYTEEMQYGTAFVFMILVGMIAATSIILRIRMRKKYQW